VCGYALACCSGEEKEEPRLAAITKESSCFSKKPTVCALAISVILGSKDAAFAT
jgi:hypothetical protein